ncbi:hypothetical protein TUMEXPCC7403_15890 [Tumidithrix helvetica PCC 7403]|uniref:GAF domain-containing protein n=1 Tax=Tumidithrix helvetica TaxID=3457545 RepID=UPI003CC044B3
MSKRLTTILIVDDSEVDRATYIRYLQQDPDWSYHIIEAETLAEGIELWRSQHPEIVLVDYLLPDGDGLDLLKAMGKSSPDMQPGVIMLTGHGDERLAVQAMKLGALDYLVKRDITAISLCISVSQVRDRITLARQLQRSQQQEAMIAEIALQTRKYINLSSILNAIVQKVHEFLAVDRVIIYQFNPDMSGTVVAEAIVSPWTPCLNAQIVDTCFQSYLSGDYQEGRVFAAADIYAANLSPCHIQLLEQFQVRANLVIPIGEPQLLWGFLILHQCSEPRQWEASDIELLQRLSTQLSLSIQQAELFQSLQVLNKSLTRKGKERKRALKFTENRFRAIFDRMFQFMGLLAIDGTVLEVNKSFLTVGGIEAEKVMGRPLWETYWWQISAETQAQLKQAIALAAKGEFVRYEVDIWGANQTVIPIDFSLHPMFDRTGQVELLIPEGREIANAKRIKADLIPL